MIPLRDDQPKRSFAFVTLFIIAVNVYVFVAWQLHVGIDESVARAGFVPIELTSHEPGGWPHLFAGMFMHGGWMHLLGNMWFLWIFGAKIEDNCGHLRYLIFYLLCGVASTLAFTAMAPHSEVPLVGASGAISGVLGAYLLHHPRARVLTLIPIFFFFRIMEVRAWFFLLVWIAFQIIPEVVATRTHAGNSGGVAYAAHIGGFIAGLGLIVFFERRNESRA